MKLSLGKKFGRAHLHKINAFIIDINSRRMKRHYRILSFVHH